MLWSAENPLQTSRKQCKCEKMHLLVSPHQQHLDVVLRLEEIVDSFWILTDNVGRSKVLSCHKDGIHSQDMGDGVRCKHLGDGYQLMLRWLMVCRMKGMVRSDRGWKALHLLEVNTRIPLTASPQVACCHPLVPAWNALAVGVLVRALSQGWKIWCPWGLAVENPRKCTFLENKIY